MEEIEFVYFKKVCKGGGRSCGKDHISVFASKPGDKNPSYRVCLNSYITGIIMSKGCEFVKYGSSKFTGKKFLVFDKDSENGYPISMPTKNVPNIVIYSKQIALFLRQTLNLKDEETRVWCSDDLANKDDIVTIEIKRD